MKFPSITEMTFAEKKLLDDVLNQFDTPEWEK